MTNKYVGLEQYKRGIDSIKKYIDKSIPHIKTQELITIPADTVLEIYNGSIGMEFDKPSDIDLNCSFVINYNNTDFNCVVEDSEFGDLISYINDNIDIIFVPGYDINQNINENKMVVFISRLNLNITPTDLVLKQIDINYLKNKCLKDDVAIKNSITIGTRNAANDIGLYSFSNGKLNTVSGPNSHAEGLRCTASGVDSHAEGCRATALGENSHAEGNSTEASGNASHAEGEYTTASGNASHAEGSNTIASGYNSHAEGSGTIAKGDNSHTQGKYNIEDTNNKYAHIVGNGTYSARSNAHTIDWNGNAWYQGSVYTGGTGQDDANAKKLATEDYVNRNKVSKTSELTNDSGFITRETLLDIVNYIDEDINDSTPRITYKDCYAYTFNKVDLSSIIGTLRIDIQAQGMSEPAITYSNFVYDESMEAYYAYLNQDGNIDEYDRVYITTNNSNTIIVYSTEVNYAGAWTHVRAYAQGEKYASVDYVNNSISSIVVPTKTSDLTNDSGFITSIPSEYITDTELTAKNYIDNTTLESKGYLTEHQDISGLALKSELHTHTNKAILDAITSDKISSWDNKSTFSGSYKDLADKPTIPSVEGFATESYVDSKFFSEEIIFEGQSNDPLVLHDYYTHVPIADGMGFWVINKTIEINSSNNPYIIEISGSQGKDGVYGPNVSTFNSTYNMWVYDLGNNDKLQMGNIEYNGSPALAVAWDTAGSYSNLKITKRIDLMNTINSKVDKISGKGLSTNDLTNTLKANYDAAYNHSKSAHAPSNAQKNSDITKAEIEAKLTGNITTHIHSQYLTTHQSLDGYAKTTDLATVATSGNYNDLTNKPTIPSIDGLATTNYVDSKVAGIVNSAPETLDTLNELATALGNDANFATTVSNQIGSKVDKVNGKGLSTNDLTNELKTNYDAAYTHSTSVHAPSNAQKNSDITKSEIEAKLTGNITTHTHSQYLTSIPSEYITEQELTSKGYITEAVLTSKGYATATTNEEVKTTVNQILGGAYIE